MDYGRLNFFNRLNEEIVGEGVEANYFMLVEFNILGKILLVVVIFRFLFHPNY